MRGLVATLISWGPWGLLLFAFLDGAGVPIPGGVDALVVFLASRSPAFFFQLAVIATVGSTLGNLVLFAISRKGGQIYLDKRSSSRWGRKFRAWFDHYGLLTVFISALVPLPVMPMKIFVICSGALGETPFAFAATFIGARLPRYVGLAYLGSQLGVNALSYLRSHVWHLTGFALALFLVLMVLVKLRDRSRAALTDSK